jgi:hypothetical protein
VHIHITWICVSNTTITKKYVESKYVIIRVIREVTLSLGLLSPPIPSFSCIRKVRKFIKSQDEILKLSI